MHCALTNLEKCAAGQLGKSPLEHVSFVAQMFTPTVTWFVRRYFVTQGACYCWRDRHRATFFALETIPPLLAISSKGADSLCTPHFLALHKQSPVSPHVAPSFHKTAQNLTNTQHFKKGEEEKTPKTHWHHTMQMGMVSGDPMMVQMS